MGGLIRHNLKKARGQFLSFGIVMMITAIILNTALVLLFQTGDAYDERFEELNTADISITVPSALAYDGLGEEIASLTGVSYVEENKALFASAALQEFQGSEFTMNTFFISFRMSAHFPGIQKRGRPKEQMNPESISRCIFLHLAVTKQVKKYAI